MHARHMYHRSASCFPGHGVCVVMTALGKYSVCSRHQALVGCSKMYQNLDLSGHHHLRAQVSVRMWVAFLRTHTSLSSQTPHFTTSCGKMHQNPDLSGHHHLECSYFLIWVVFECSYFLIWVVFHWPFQGAQEHRRSRDLKNCRTSILADGR